MTSVAAFDLEPLSEKEKGAISLNLDAFVAQHGCMHRPIALVSSGGTAADLERRSVRCLENFSTGLRGAVSVEGFLRRGYAVIHLWREGSAAPFARVLAEELGVAPNSAIGTRSMTRLFATGGGGEKGTGDGEDEPSLQEILRKQDPWLTKSEMEGDKYEYLSKETDNTRDSCRLSRRVRHSSRIQKALQELQTVTQENRLLTIPYRTVDQYLAKLQLCAESIQPCHCLALVYLAAAVSDFYIPFSLRTEHKIQSSESSDETTGLTVQLRPVPKAIGILRSAWAPSAFCVSFKLETDHAILRKKAERAVQFYGVHLVIGNILETRHKKVWILAPESHRSKRPENAEKWTFEEISKTAQASDELEDFILDKVVESHFEYVSWHIPGEGVDSMRQAQEALQKKRKDIQKRLYWKRVHAIGMEVAGYVLSGMLSWAVASTIQRLRRVG